MRNDPRGELLWRSVDEITATNAAYNLPVTLTPYLTRPWITKLNKKSVWKVPVYDLSNGKPKFEC